MSTPDVTPESKQRFRGQFQALLIGDQRHPGVGHFRHQRDLLRAARFLGAEVGLQAGLGQVAHLAEEVQLIRGHRQAAGVLAVDGGLAGAGHGRRRARRGLGDVGRQFRQQRRRVDVVLRLGLLDVEHRNAQVAVVHQRQLDHLAQLVVGEVVAPLDLRHRLGVGRRRRHALVGVARRPGPRHRLIGALIHRRQAATSQHRQRGHCD
jgi:hypothetical protein